MAWRRCLPRNFSFLSHSTVGRTKARVLPLPVKSLAMISSLLYMDGKVWS